MSKEPVVHFEGRDMPVSQWLQLIRDRDQMVNAVDRIVDLKLTGEEVVSIAHMVQAQFGLSDHELAVAMSVAARQFREAAHRDLKHADRLQKQSGLDAEPDGLVLPWPGRGRS
jgi:hypothetical protein